jgi:hypothetical protein
MCFLPRCCVAVNGYKLARSGAVITYTVRFVNGITPVRVNSSLTLPITGLAAGTAFTTCRNAANAVVTLPLTSGLAANAALTCTYELTVGSTMLTSNSSAIRPFSVRARTSPTVNSTVNATDYGPSLSLGGEPVHLAGSVAVIGISAEVNDPDNNPATQPYAIGATIILFRNCSHAG